MDYDATGQLLIIYSAFIKYLRKKKKGNTMKQCISLFVDFKKAYDSVRREFLYNIVIEFAIPMKLVRLIKMCLNETSTRDCIDKHLSDMFPIKNGLKCDALLALLFSSALEYAIRRVQGNQMT